MTGRASGIRETGRSGRSPGARISVDGSNSFGTERFSRRAGGDRNDSRQRQGQLGGARSRRDGHRHQPGHAGRRARRRPTATGQYALRLLPSATTRSKSRSTGFKNFSQTGIVLEVGRNARIDATIEPGDVPGSRVGHRRRAARRNQLRRRCRGRSARTRS